MRWPTEQPQKIARRSIGLGAAVALGLSLTFGLFEYAQYQVAKKAQFQALQERLGTLASVAASVIDGDLHKTLDDPSEENGEDYRRALEPLIRFHNAAPNLYYVYTMVCRDGREFYVLDTAKAADRLHVPWKLAASALMEPRTPYDEAEDALMRKAVADGGTYVYTKPYNDPVYGEFLTGVAPIRDAAGAVVGIAAVDYSTEYVEGLTARVRRISWMAGLWGVVFAVVAGAAAGIVRAARWRILRERHRSRELLEQRSQDFRAAVETSSDGFAVVDFSGVYHDVNESYCRIVEWPREAIIGQSIFDLHPEGPREVVDEQLKTIRTEGRLSTRIRKFRSDGRTHHLDLNAVRAPGGEDRAFVFMHDITDMMDADAAIRESEHRYRTLLETIPHGVFHKDLDGRLVTVNSAFRRSLGLEGVEVVGKRDEDLFPPEFAAKYRADDRRIVETRATESIEEKVWRDGEEFYVHTVKTPVTDENGRVIGVLGIFWDVTEMRRKTEQLVKLNREVVAQGMETQKALEEARTANAYKTRFLANISHEVRSPVNRIRGLASILQMNGDVDDQKRARYYDIIIQSCDALVRVLEHLLTLSRVEAGQAKPIPVAFDPVASVERLASRFTHYAGAKGLAFGARVDPACPRRLSADAVMVETILSNLLDNAVKFTTEGRVDIEVRGEGREGGRARLAFVVSDTGPGIPEDERVKIFQSFYQIEDFATRTKGGSGLGLAIASEFARLLGGELALIDRESKGSAFRFTCVFDEAPPVEPEKDPAPAQA